MQIAKGIDMLALTVNVMGQSVGIYPVLLRDGRDIVLVDAGYPSPSALLALTEALAELNLTLQDLTKVILTHQDLDHIGTLPAIVAANPAAETMCHVLEKPYIEGTEKLTKLHKHTIDIMENMPEPVKAALQKAYDHPPSAHIDTVLQDGDVLPLLGGVTVIHTPGHTVGHISLYVQNSKTLIAGDALTANDGKLSGPVKAHADDYEQALASLDRLKALDISKIICYHGGLVQGELAL
jgi:glyoxylase-like metal-dependent hydrolase (beta-lactamase superfamily II)